MSTRASVIVKDANDKLFFYQHSDGYPDGLGKTLVEFLESDKAKKQKYDLEYFAGVMLMEVNRDYIENNLSLPDLVPALGLHGDESYQYIIDVDNFILETIKL